MPNVWESWSSRQFIKGLITGTFHSVHACPVIKHHDWVFSPIAELGEWHLASRQRDNMSELLLQCKKLNILSTWRQKLCCLIVYSTYSHRATRNTYFAFWLWRDSFSDSPALLTIMYSTLSTVQYNVFFLQNMYHTIMEFNKILCQPLTFQSVHSQVWWNFLYCMKGTVFFVSLHDVITVFLVNLWRYCLVDLREFH